MQTTVDLQGMHCDACVQRVANALRAVPGVTSATVTLNPPRAVVTGDAPIDHDAMRRAVEAAGAYRVLHQDTVAEVAPASLDAGATSKPSLYPLILIVTFIVGITGLTTFVRNEGTWHDFMHDFMAGFFLVFSFFKLLNLRGFADAYQMYDLLARASRPWAFAYPFVELALGLCYLLRYQIVAANIATLLLMLVGAAGVLRALMDRRQIRCACLGTALNLPMTTVTLVEDLTMAAMAAAMLIAR